MAQFHCIQHHGDSTSLPVFQNRLALFQLCTPRRLLPDQLALLGILGLGARVQRLPAVEIQSLGLAILSAQARAKGSLQNVGPRALRRPHRPVGEQVADNWHNEAKDEDADHPGRGALVARDHRAGVDAQDADVAEGRILVQAPLQLAHHHYDAKLSSAVASKAAAKGRVFLCRTPGAPGHGLEAGFIVAHQLLVFVVVERSVAGVARVGWAAV